MTHKLYNKLGQPLIHKGQLCINDKVSILYSDRPYKVIKLGKAVGVVMSNLGCTYHISFTKEKGWMFWVR